MCELDPVSVLVTRRLEAASQDTKAKAKQVIMTDLAGRLQVESDNI